MKKTYEIKKQNNKSLLSVQLEWDETSDKTRTTVSHNHGEIKQSMLPEWKAKP
jgi:hypothetical protein